MKANNRAFPEQISQFGKFDKLRWSKLLLRNQFQEVKLRPNHYFGNDTLPIDTFGTPAS